jgi:DNA repair exonuclease SbcCD ATPase subunit
MEREVRERYERMEALLRAGIERGNQMDARFNERMDRAEKRMELADKRMDRVDKRMDRAEQRMDRSEQRLERAEHRTEIFDCRLETTRKLVEAGMKIMVRMGQRQQAVEDAIRELTKSQKAFLDSLRKGGNGSRHLT